MGEMGMQEREGLQADLLYELEVLNFKPNSFVLTQPIHESVGGNNIGVESLKGQYSETSQGLYQCFGLAISIDQGVETHSTSRTTFLHHQIYQF